MKIEQPKHDLKTLIAVLPRISADKTVDVVSRLPRYAHDGMKKIYGGAHSVTRSESASWRYESSGAFEVALQVVLKG